MDIVKNLPFDFCESCPEFILKTDEQVLFSDNSIATRQIVVTCHHDWLCKQLAEKGKEKSNAR